MTDRAHVHQCPYRKLRFLYANEITSQVVADHPAHANSDANMTRAEVEREAHS